MNRVGDFNLWSLGYGDPAGAKAARAQVLRVESHYGLRVLDAIVVSRLPDGIRGLGGTVMHTNVAPDLARRVRETLSASARTT
jgi:hypothetical protein